MTAQREADHNQARARRAWGDEAPDWILELARACDRQSQRRLSQRLGYSPSTINQVLSNTYRGDLKAVRKAVSGALMHGTVTCPILGEIPSHRCLSIQRQPFAATNALRVRLYRACRSGCPNSRLGGDHDQ